MKKPAKETIINSAILYKCLKKGAKPAAPKEGWVSGLNHLSAKKANM